jgi:hypothetical protein
MSCRKKLYDELSVRNIRLRRLSAAKQLRLDELMAGHNEGRLTAAPRRELQGLVRETEEIALDNARRLASRRRASSASHRSQKGY